MVRLLNHDVLSSLREEVQRRSEAQDDIRSQLASFSKSWSSHLRVKLGINERVFPYSIKWNSRAIKDYKSVVEDLWNRGQLTRDEYLSSLRYHLQNQIDCRAMKVGEANKIGSAIDDLFTSYYSSFVLRVQSEWLIKLFESHSEKDGNIDFFEEVKTEDARKYFLHFTGSTSRMRLAIYKNMLFSVKCMGTSEDVKLLLDEYYEKEQKKLKSLRARRK